MIFTETELKDAYIIEPKLFGDSRGWFFESYSKKEFEKNGIFIDFVQDNRSYNEKAGVLRGLHCQINPFAQAKLVTCLTGSIMDFIVDVRESSPTYKKWIKVELTAENKRFLLIPRGFLHGYVALEDKSEFMYKVDNFYSPECDRSIAFNDPEFNIDWGIQNPQLSDKDKNAPLFINSDVKY